MCFTNYLKDDFFIEMVISGSLESENYIEELITDNPDEKEEILLAVEFVRSLRHSPLHLSSKEISDLWENISGKKDSKTAIILQPNPGSKRKVKLSFFLKLAASVAILIAVGILGYQKFSNNDFKTLAENTLVPEDDALIILSDGSRHLLTDNNSHVEYQSDGNEVLINKPDHQTEKFVNRAAGEENTLNQIVIPFGRRHTLTLCDGTEVQLNSGSKLIFPAKFTGRTREVYLTGEGFFDVAKNTDKTFIVKTDFLNVKVTGTQFNISAYQDEDIVSTVLVEGAVEITRKNKLINKPQENFSPGQACFYSVSTSTSEVRNVNVSQYISWTNGFFQFKDLILKDVLKKIEKYYKKSVFVEDETLLKTVISGKLLLSDNFDNVMIYLSKTLEADYDIMENGTYYIK